MADMLELSSCPLDSRHEKAVFLMSAAGYFCMVLYSGLKGRRHKVELITHKVTFPLLEK
jgi:hypothetical protein